MKIPIGNLACNSLGLSSAFALSLLPLWVFWWVQWQNSIDVLASNIIRVFGVYAVFLIAYVSWKLRRELPRNLVYRFLPVLFITTIAIVLAETFLTKNVALAFRGVEAQVAFGVEPLSTLTWGLSAFALLFLADRKALPPTDGFAFTAVSILFISNVWQLPEEYDILFYNWSWYFAGLAFIYMLYRLHWKPTRLFVVNVAVCLTTFALWSIRIYPSVLFTGLPTASLPVWFLRVPFAFLPLTMLQEMKT